MDIPFKVLEAIRDAGGVPLLVGGAVRDAALSRRSKCLFEGPTKISLESLEKSKDLDFEVRGLSLLQLQDVLEKFGTVDLIGKAFGILKLHEMQNVDFSIPRRDNKSGVGHKGFETTLDPMMTLEDAAKRRDLTINSMALDLFTGELHDPFNGLRDLKNGQLRATDPVTFLDDPLRALRVAQFISRFGFHVPNGSTLFVLCQQADLSQLPGERLFAEFEKLLLGASPDMGLQFLADTGLLKFFPELEATRNTPQEREWHPEGSVLVHSIMAVRQARLLTDDLTVLWATLCHDLGKPSTTNFEDGKIRSRNHENAGVEPATALLTRLRAPNELIARVTALVAHHLAPAHFVPDEAHKGKRTAAGAGAYRRLARVLGQAGTNLETLFLVSKADHLGRTSPQALLKQFPSGDEFLRRAREIKVEKSPEHDAVMGRHLVARGMKPGPEFGQILRKCRELQDETGLTDPDELLAKVLTKVL